MESESKTGIVAPYLLAIDVGGTHTDIELVDVRSGRTFRHKIASTPKTPANAVREGTREILALAGVEPSEVGYFAHGMTVATNALVQGRLAKAALLTTKGFRDILEIRRQRQPHIYNTRVSKPLPPIERNLRIEIDERQFLFGIADVTPDDAEIEEIAKHLRESGVDAVAVCFMHSYRDPAHERMVGDKLAGLLPDVFLSVSCDVMPEFREYERTSTTAINAALGPVMQRYLSSIEKDAAENGITVTPRIMQSNGGVTSPEEAGRVPVRTLASGPAAGVIGATEIARKLGIENIISFDVGGTTADVCLVEKYNPLVAVEREFGGYPVRSSTIDSLSVGAGGGSIAWSDSGGFLHVGPQSAGADPGPVCYGNGGTEPTVTDANLVLGRLNPDGLLSGRLAVDVEAARRAIEIKVGTPHGLSVEEAAAGILTILNENMVQAVRVISVERGFDPRDFTLVAFGGGGPLLAGKLARELGITRIVVPRSPGLLCAEGLLVAETRADFSLTRFTEIGAETWPVVLDQLSQLQAAAADWFVKEDIPAGAGSTDFAVDMRYRGQSHELRVELNIKDPGEASADMLRERFLEEHRKAYGFASDLPMEIVTIRSVARAPNHPRPAEEATVDAGDPIVGYRQVYFSSEKGYVTCPIYDRRRIAPGMVILGPAIVEQMDSTTVVEPGDEIESMQTGDLIQRIRPSPAATG